MPQKVIRIGANRRYRRKLDDPEVGGVIDLDDSKFMASTKALGRFALIVVASLFPVFAILALYFIHTTLVRIYVTICLTAAFGIILKLCTTAEDKEIFAATATFAAVEVVFIGSANVA